LAFLVVDRDPFLRDRLDVFDAIEGVDPAAVPEGVAAVFADIRERLGLGRIAEVSVPASRANAGADRGQLRVGSHRIRAADIKLGSVKSESASLVGDEAAWAELG